VADVPLLVIGAARPELLERRPAWAGGKANATTLSLSPLSGEETLQLVRGLAEQHQLSAHAEDTLVEQSAGNPLYAEQFVRVWEERGDGGELPLPETLQSLIAARLDNLPQTEKAVLQNAAVLGKVFWRGAVIAVDGIEPATAAESLNALQRKQFVQRAQRSSVADDSEFAFRHVLVRDVAYNQIPRARRAEKHERAAGWINSLARREDHAEMLAHHYLTALELAEAIGESTTAIAGPARTALRQAGDRAFALHAYPAAHRYYARAIELFPADHAELPELLFRFGQALANAGDERSDEALARARDALIVAEERGRAAEASALLAEIWWHRGRRKLANEELERARGLVAAASDSPSKAWVLSNVSRSSMLAGDSETALRLGQEALALAEKLDLDDVRAHALNNIGTARCNAGDLGGIADLERSIEIATASAPGELARAYNNLATVYGEHVGDVPRERELRREAVRAAESVGDRRLARYSGAILMYDDYAAGNWDEFVAKAQDFIKESERLGGGYQDAFFHASLGEIALARGDDADALAEAEQALALAETAGDPQVLLAALADASVINLELGNVDDAQKLARRLVDRASELRKTGSALGNFPFGARLGLAAAKLGIEPELRTVVAIVPAENRWVRPFAALLDGEYAAAADGYAEMAPGPSPPEAYVRLHGGKRLLESGRADEARTQLERALAFYRPAGATRYVREAEELLAVIRSPDEREAVKGP
jgi:tetratricopeptide (TPR) repeat protein